MASVNEERIRIRAHEIWEEEGRPEGRDRDHWERAWRELTADEGRSFGGAGREGAGASNGSDLLGA